MGNHDPLHLTLLPSLRITRFMPSTTRAPVGLLPIGQACYVTTYHTLHVGHNMRVVPYLLGGRARYLTCQGADPARRSGVDVASRLC
jgi:hypothetical protein